MRIEIENKMYGCSKHYDCPNGRELSFPKRYKVLCTKDELWALYKILTAVDNTPKEKKIIKELKDILDRGK
jgi:hypothetical protein